MQYRIPCNRLTYNFLHKKLNGKPLSVDDRVGYFLYVMVQGPKRGRRKEMPGTNHGLYYNAELDHVHGSRCRGGHLLNATECDMIGTYTEIVLKSELKRLLDESDEYNATFEEFQEEYNLSDLDMSRDEMYKWYERLHTGKSSHRYEVPDLLLPQYWPPDHMG
jgi:hypothetical protein